MAKRQVKITKTGTLSATAGLTKTQFNNVKQALIDAGGYSRDAVPYNTAKSTIVVEGCGKILHSRPDYRRNVKAGKKGYDVVISYTDFMNHPDKNGLITGSADSYDASAADCCEAIAISEQALQAVCKEAFPQPTDKLEVADVTILTQDPVIFAALGVSQLRNAGLDITETDGKLYVIDTDSNTSTEVNAEQVAEQAKTDFLANDGDTPYTIYATNMNLVESISHKKPSKDAPAADENTEIVTA